MHKPSGRYRLLCCGMRRVYGTVLVAPLGPASRAPRLPWVRRDDGAYAAILYRPF